ncbi:hypothetical protein [Phaeospirillum tilakii]|uniref:Lipoprotein n=1 Tax=Phaeospirillum tilakii TaxID=741673 RepID=A0ABW5C8B6_9PROT
MSRLSRAGAALALGLALAACQTAPEHPLVMSTKSPVALRAMQSRVFDTPDRTRMLRAVVATLQDLDYVVDKVEPQAGTVTATRSAMLRLTATVYPRGAGQMTVRANAVIDLGPKSNQIDAPEFYQKLFFEPLSKAVFLQAVQVEDPGEPPAAPPAPAPDGNQGSQK